MERDTWPQLTPATRRRDEICLFTSKRWGWIIPSHHVKKLWPELVEISPCTGTAHANWTVSVAHFDRALSWHPCSLPDFKTGWSFLHRHHDRILRRTDSHVGGTAGSRQAEGFTRSHKRRCFLGKWILRLRKLRDNSPAQTLNTHAMSPSPGILTPRQAWKVQSLFFIWWVLPLSSNKALQHKVRVGQFVLCILPV